MGSLYSMDTLDKGIIHVLGGTDVRFHRTTHFSAQFRTYKLFISGILHLIFADYSWLLVTKAIASETVNKRTTVYFYRLIEQGLIITYYILSTLLHAMKDQNKKYKIVDLKNLILSIYSL